MTPVSSTRFVGRLAEMWEVHSLLNATDMAQITGAVVNVGQVSGLGGVGKSLLAEEYGLRFGAAYPGGVFWMRAYGNDDSKAVLGPQELETLRADQIRAMAERLGINTQGMTIAQIEGALKRAVRDRGEPCLWVVDDVPIGLNGEALRAWFAPHALARTLITTRSREYGGLAEGIDLSVLAPEEAYQLLTSRVSPLDDKEQAQARALAKDLGYHALALDITASAVSSFGGLTPFASFRAQLARTDKDALELARDLADAIPNGHEASIAQTMLRSVRNLGAEGQDFLRLASVLAAAPIPASLVSAVFEEADDLSQEDAAWRQAHAFDQVRKASLAEITLDKQKARSVHPLVSRVMRFRERSTPDRTDTLRSEAVEALKWQMFVNATLFPRHPQFELHMAHARQVVTIAQGLSEAALMGWVARYDLEDGAYGSAEALAQRAVELYRGVPGPEHPDMLTSMDRLAAAKFAQGDFTTARKLQEEVLAARGRVLGPEDPNTLASMDHLAETLKAQGDLAAARKLQETALDIYDRRLGRAHPHTLATMDNLAGTLRGLGDLVRARELQEKALAIYRLLGPERPDTLTAMSNLALTLISLGDVGGARKLLEEALAIQRQVLGPEHPGTLISMVNLGCTLKTQGDFARARKLLEDAFAIQRRVLGSKHPTTTHSAWLLIELLHALDDRAAARVVMERDLLWLLDCDPAGLGAIQREIHGFLVQLRQRRAVGRLSRPTPFLSGGATDQTVVQHVSRGAKIGRNAPCPCGSGKKYKKCCGA